MKIVTMDEFGAEEEFVEPPDELKIEDDNVEIGELPRSFTSKARKREIRTETTSDVSEFHVTPVDGRVELYDLVRCLDGGAQQADLKKRMRRVAKKDKVVDVPLSKHELEKITRIVQYEKTSKDISHWEPVVKQNRKADQLKFPLNESEITVHQTTAQLAQQKQKPRSELEVQIAAILQQSQPVVAVAERPLSRREEMALKAMSLEEARLKRAELQRDRARAAFVAAKLRQQGKIKSRRFHRSQRKSRQKQEQKKLERMAADNPEAYQSWVRNAEKQRIQERMSLRHKGTSRFMQKQTRYGKFNLVSRQAVQDMLQQGQTLRRKEAATDDAGDAETSSDEADMEQVIHESTSRKTTLEDMEGSFSDDDVDAEEVMEKTGDSDDDLSDVMVKAAVESEQGSSCTSRKAPKNLQINPSQYLVVEAEQSATPRNDAEAKVALAFAGDDDIVAEFAAEKEKIIERERPKDIDLRLPGWGEWSGPGIKPSQHRKKRFVIKAPRGPPRKDSDLSHVIISEAKDKAVAKHQVNSLPHPFHNVLEFEKRIQQPIGRTWNSVATFKKLTKPKVVTRLGKVIAPIEKSEAFKKIVADSKQKARTDSAMNRRRLKTAKI